MSRNRYRSFGKKDVDERPVSTFSTSLGEMKDIDEIYKEPDLDGKNEIAAEKEADSEVETVKYKEKEYKIESKVVEEDPWHDGIVTALSNMRSEPNLGSDVLTVLNPGTKIKIYAKQFFNVDFYKIKFGDMDGYLKTGLAKITF